MFSSTGLCAALLFLASVVLAANQTETSNNTLVLLHVLHRHGDRTPNNIGYANNPISNESFYYPYGFGEVSKNGMRTAYKIGILLRQRYSSYLGDVLNLKYNYARSTDASRTKASLELVLAALWPPRRQEKFWPCLNWQPVPFYYDGRDMQLNGHRCQVYRDEYNAVFNSTATQSAISVYQEWYDYISNATGEDFSTPSDVFNLYMDITAQIAYGYPIEDWLKPIYPEIMERIAVDQYYLDANTTLLRQYGAGFLLKKIIEDTQSKINGTISPAERKLFIYAAHERNLAFTLISLGVFNDRVPPYGCFILFEVHLIDGVYGFKIFYHDWTTTDPKLMIIPGCQEFCPFDSFTELLKDVIPDTAGC
ncbi:venom acid phosphatase Acph-1-like [Rhynchophorus ferrugineus]|uniref:venom acid phosphatase Acph-1-like n=1 Tax=Rhynchophorus ferrugineus TaxID=354439 RepID=UPI003FCECF1A